MDRIIIEDLEVLCHVGVPDEERRTPQRLLLCVELRSDFTRAAQGDDLTATIDYFRVTQRLLAFTATGEWKLIEKLAVDLAGLILAEFRPQSVMVRVKKFILPQTRYVAVEVTRPLG